MKVWWCELHRAAESAEEGICEVGARMLLVPGPYPKADYPEPCEIREMQLVPADALVVQKANGEWSDSTVLAFDTAAHALAETHHGREDLRLAFDVFIAALASDSADV